jgi:hypothetical protein
MPMPNAEPSRLALTRWGFCCLLVASSVFAQFLHLCKVTVEPTRSNPSEIHNDLNLLPCHACSVSTPPNFWHMQLWTYFNDPRILADKWPCTVGLPPSSEASVSLLQCCLLPVTCTLILKVLKHPDTVQHIGPTSQHWI